MRRVEELYAAIEADDLERLDALLNRDPALVEGAGATPPPIHWAIFHDRREVVRALLSGGADIERRDQDRDATPLAYAIVYGRAEIARSLLDEGAERAGMRDLVRRGAAGEFAQYPDVAPAETFAELASLFEPT